ncbi:hypothetical protein [Pseudonocardia acaciae]|uniref:hypothetical protein n=1 Tax=Pseudonocardia acaciae TaxID=551276 RepID=UPI00049194FE|nr:hypothetical protein [Pseudonocardia acaciae]
MDTYTTTTNRPPTPPACAGGSAALRMAEFVGLLADAARIASTNPDTPMLCGVLLHTATHAGRPVLVASATDRFMMVQAHAPLEFGGLPGRLWLANTQLRQIRALFGTPARRRCQALHVRIAVSSHTNTATISEFEMPGMAMAALSLTPLDTGPHFPDIAKVARQEWHRSDQPVTVDPRHLARAAALCRRNESLRIELAGPRSPVRITVGERLWVYLMPRRADTTPIAPVFDPPTATPTRRAEVAA